MTRIAYLVHNLGDPAVARRIAMLRNAGAEVRVAGFSRDDRPPEEIAGARATMLGRTHDAALSQRAQMVARNLLQAGVLREVTAGADIVIARNLEMLVLGARGQGRAKLVYESLDIHRSLLGTGVAHRMLRALERALIARSALLITSSPAFVREYFLPVQRVTTPTLLLENKLLRLDGSSPARSASPSAPVPWTIGWFGNLRCRRTLATLRAIADQGEGHVEILVAGKPSPAEFPDFAADIAHPRIRFVGPYTAAQLPELYAQCHFAWAIDYFEEGLNSTWLLPNRLYEAAAHGCVPIALRSVETGRWLAERSAGLLLHPAEDAADTVGTRLRTLQPSTFAALQEGIRQIPADDLVAGPGDCRRLLEALTT